MINKHFTYINTSNQPIELLVEYSEEGVSKTLSIQLSEGSIYSANNLIKEGDGVVLDDVKVIKTS